MSTQDVPTVFIVDDDRDVRESLQELLESVGLHSKSFGTAQEFLSSPRSDGPSCLILDVRLPGISGLDLQHELKKRESKYSNHLSHSTCRRSDVGQGHEVRRC